MLDVLWHDVKYATRTLARAPGFAFAAIATLALGVGVTTAVYTVVDGLLLRPIPLATPDRLMMVWETDRQSHTRREPGSYPDFLDYRQRTRTLDRLVAFIPGDANLYPEHGDAERIAVLTVSDGFFETLGIATAAGRVFAPGELRAGGAPVVVISDRLWRDRFGRSPQAIGATLRINAQPRTIVGVASPEADFGTQQILSAAVYGRGFADRDPRATVDAWLPLQTDAGQLPRETHPLLMVGRLATTNGAPAPSVRSRLQAALVSASAAQQELAAIAADLERSYPVNQARGVFVEPLREVILAPVERPLLVLFTAVLVLLAVACVNVANLVLARAMGRTRDVAVRAALGAGAERLLGYFLIESALVTLAAVVVGVLLRAVMLRVLIAALPPTMPHVVGLEPNARLFLLATALWAIVSVSLALLPVRYARRRDIQTTLASLAGKSMSAGPRQERSRAALVVAEIALAVALVTTAGLLARSFWNLRHVNPGFDAGGVVKAELQLPPGRYRVNFAAADPAPAAARFNEALIARLAAVPGVTDVGFAVNQPLDVGFTNSFSIVGREAESRSWPEISTRIVSPGYLRVLRVAVTAGRSFDERDYAAAPRVALINQAAADRFFPGADPLGHEIMFWGMPRRIVGVIGNEKFQGLAAAAPIAVYVPLAQVPSQGGGEALLVRTSGDTTAAMSAVRSSIREIDPGVPVFALEPLADTVARSIDEPRFLMWLLMLFAANALALAAIGIHGILTFMVGQRTREIGLRMALGATSRQLLTLVVGAAARLAAIGLVAGVALALALGRGLQALLFGIGAADPVTVAGVLAMVALVALVSSYLPARRLSRVDPVTALRSE